MKKIINKPENFVFDTLGGIYKAHADQVTFVDESQKAMVKRNLKKGKVGIATGGGSGHLPLFLGYIGEGMLDGCSVGEVFASPGVDDMLSVTKAIDTGAGVLYIYGNYGGDKMNFTMSANQAEFEDNIRVLTVLGKDDVAVKNLNSRRGIAGIFFVYKCAGAAAEEMMDLDECYRIAKKAADNVRTMGVSLSACILPRVGHPSFEIAEDEMEIGMGIHGETGVRRGKIMTADKIVDELIENILTEIELKGGDEVAVLVNGLGSTPLEEQYIVTNRIYEVFEEKNINIFHTYVGEYATSMEMAGLSVSVLKLDDELKHMLSKPANAIMFRQFELNNSFLYKDVDLSVSKKEAETVINNTIYKAKDSKDAIDCMDIKKLFKTFKDMSDENKDYLVELDGVAGDGDLGLTMADGFKAVNELLKQNDFGDVGELFYSVGKKFAVNAPSSLGTLLAFGFIGIGKDFRDNTEVSKLKFVDMLKSFEKAIMELGGAKLGDKTFLDGFDPAIKVLEKANSDEDVTSLMPDAVKASKEGVEKAKNMIAQFGRVSFKGEASIGITDPGSVLASLLVEAIADWMTA